MYIVSACLVGQNCKYHGGNNRNEAVLRFLEGKRWIALCPEELGGLLTPREPCERLGGRVLNRLGEDVTEAFLQGAARALALARERGEAIEGAILKEQSPSCGIHRIYDGSFQGGKIPGEGCFAALLRQEGIPLFSEEDIEAKERT